MNDLVTIIIPLYNKVDAIKDTIGSVMGQSYSNWELLIIDDGSNDGSSDVVKDYLDDNRIKYYKKNNGGVSSARNFGLMKAKGEWLIFLDADDTFLPNALSSLVELAQTYHKPINTGNFYLVNNNGSKTLFYKKKGKGVVFNNFRSSFFHQFGARTGVQLFSRKTIKDHFFDENLSRYEDAKNEFELFEKYSIAYTSEAVLNYNVTNSFLSTNFNFSKDFISEIDLKNKSFWERMLLFELLDQGVSIYKDHHLRRKYLKYVWLLPIYILLDFIRRVYLKLY